MSDPTRNGLRLEPGLADPDAVYEALIDLHRDLDDTRSALVNAKLVLLLANHIGDGAVLAEAMRRAREGIVATSPEAAASESDR